MPNQFSRLIGSLSACLLVAFTWAAPNQSDAQQIVPLQKFMGISQQNDLESLAPQSGVITRDSELNRIWRGWSIEEPKPDVAFERQMVLVKTVPGPNRTIVGPLKLEGGDLTYRVASTRRGGPGFGYLLMLVSRNGIEKVNGITVPEPGKPMDEPADAITDSIEVTVVGSIQTGVMAIGGESTGTTITSGGVTWEMDLQNASQIQLAKSLSRSKAKARVRGMLVRIEGVEIKVRWIVVVDSLEDASQRPRPQVAAKPLNDVPAAVPNRALPANAVPIDQLKPAGLAKAGETGQVTTGEDQVVADAIDFPTTGYNQIQITMSGGKLDRKYTHKVTPRGKATIDDGTDAQSYQIPPKRLKLLHEHIARVNWKDVPKLNRSDNPDDTTFEIEIQTIKGIHRLYLDAERIKDMAEVQIMFRLLRK